MHGRIDVIVNNAGVMPHSPLDRGKLADWDRMIDVNVKGVLYGIAAALPPMKAQKSGHSIDVSSVAGHKVRPGSAVYAATKAALRMLTEGLRLEVKATAFARQSSHPALSNQNCRPASPSPILPRVCRRFTKALRYRRSPFVRFVAFTITQPDAVDINEILFRPTAQEY